MKDGDDDPGVFFMDSDGSVSIIGERNVTDHVDIEDGDWHMITITTQPSGKKGYRIYIDGELAAATPNQKGLARFVGIQIQT